MAGCWVITNRCGGRVRDGPTGFPGAHNIYLPRVARAVRARACMSRTMLSSVVNDVARASSSDHPADAGPAASSTKRAKYAPHVACAVAAAAVAVAPFSSPPLPPPPPPPPPFYARRPDAAHSFYGLAWWPPRCATYRTEGLTERPAAAPAKRGARTRTAATEGSNSAPTCGGARAQGRLPCPRAALHGRYPGASCRPSGLRLRDPRPAVRARATGKLRRNGAPACRSTP